MSNLSSYQPFLIGNFGAGQFNYLEPWQSPDDAFDPLQNAYTYRGSIQKRQGYQEWGYTGLLRYTNNEVGPVLGNGILTTFNIQLDKFPVEPSSVTISAAVGAVVLQCTDDGVGGFAGALDAGTSTIDYITGAISLDTSAAVDLNAPIVVQYTFTNSNTDEVIGTGDGTTVHFTGTLSNIPIVPLSLEITSTALAGAVLINDDGRGYLTGSLIDQSAPLSTINYTTGVFDFYLTSAIVNLTDIIATYIVVGSANPIMGINYWENENTSAQVLTVQDQKRMCVFDTVTKLFDPISTFSQVNYTTTAVGGGPFTLTTGFTNLAPYTITVTSSDASTTTDDGLGAFPANGTIAISSVVYATGVITLSVTGAAPAATYTVTASLQGDYFTGNDDNFFNFTNWKASDGEVAYLYLTNNKDRITLYDGTNLSRPAFPILEADINTHVNGILTCLDLKVYKNRLLAIRPTVTGSIVEGQSIRYSSEFYFFGTTSIPFDFVADVSGHGGLSQAPTGDWLIADEFLRDVLVTFMQRSTWVFRFTGSAFSPFRWDQINNSRTTNAPYGSIDYDGKVTAIGTKGLIACDGVNVDRYDLSIVDQYQDIDNDHFIQCFGTRDDVLYQSWMLYPSVRRNQVANQFSDTAFIYNFLENSFAQYNIELSCLGIANTYQDILWSSFAPGSGVWTEGLTWQQCNFTWNKFLSQSLSPVLLGGNQNGYVYGLNSTETDNGAHIETKIKSKRWNPFITTGERCRFGYIDFYYEINPDVTIQVDIYVNNSKAPDYTKHLVMDGPEDDDFAWKRIQVNAYGEFIRIQISTPIINPGQWNNETQEWEQDLNDGTFKITGIILWAMPAGRLIQMGSQ